MVDEADTIAPTIQLNGLQLYNENIPWVNLLKKQDSSLTLGNGVTVSDFKFDEVSKWYGLPEHLSLAYNNNYLTFNFIGITMNQPKNVKYRYKLEGLDGDWSALTNRTEAPYGNIPHGTYTFKVKAMNSEGYWSKPLEYTFTIRPPWWLTWWFKTLVVLFVVGSVWYYIKWRERAYKNRQIELEHIVEIRTAEVVAEKKIVEKEKNEADKQRKRSDDLLLNILPAEVAEELKAKGSADAKQFDEVTVMFTDFKALHRFRKS